MHWNVTGWNTVEGVGSWVEAVSLIGLVILIQNWLYFLCKSYGTIKGFIQSVPVSGLILVQLSACIACRCCGWVWLHHCDTRNRERQQGFIMGVWSWVICGVLVVVVVIVDGSNEIRGR